MTSDEELLMFADELLPQERSSHIEEQLRNSEELRTRLGEVLRARDQGGHTVGEIWRRHRLSCPQSSELGRYLLKALKPEQLDYIDFHLNTIACPFCQAQIEEMSAALAARDKESNIRRTRLFESSAGFLNK